MHTTHQSQATETCHGHVEVWSGTDTRTSAGSLHGQHVKPVSSVGAGVRAITFLPATLPTTKDVQHLEL